MQNEHGEIPHPRCVDLCHDFMMYGAKSGNFLYIHSINVTTCTSLRTGTILISRVHDITKGESIKNI